jgi:uncharacterized protein (TIGR02145 family)
MTLQIQHIQSLLHELAALEARRAQALAELEELRRSAEALGDQEEVSALLLNINLYSLLAEQQRQKTEALRRRLEKALKATGAGLGGHRKVLALGVLLLLVAGLAFGFLWMQNERSEREAERLAQEAQAKADSLVAAAQAKVDSLEAIAQAKTDSLMAVALARLDSAAAKARADSVAAVKAKPAAEAGAGSLSGYSSVNIDGMVWMAKNLNVKPKRGNSWCYEGVAANCKKYGRLYDWEAAMSVCPAGWRLPSNGDWNFLARAVGGSSVAGRTLKSRSGWNGSDDYGFSALPGGYWSGSYFDNAGYDGEWWSSSNDSSGDAYGCFMNSSDDGLYIYEYARDKSDGRSVRCVKD